MLVMKVIMITLIDIKNAKNFYKKRDKKLFFQGLHEGFIQLSDSENPNSENLPSLAEYTL